MWIEVTLVNKLKRMVNLNYVDSVGITNDRKTFIALNAEQEVVLIVETYEWVKQFLKPAAPVLDASI